MKPTTENCGVVHSSVQQYTSNAAKLQALRKVTEGSCYCQYLRCESPLTDPDLEIRFADPFRLSLLDASIQWLGREYQS
jgi:hypothetical protein